MMAKPHSEAQPHRINNKISKYTNIIDIDAEDSMYGMANSVRLGNMVLCASNISELKKTDEDLTQTQ